MSSEIRELGSVLVERINSMEEHIVQYNDVNLVDEEILEFENHTKSLWENISIVYPNLPQTKMTPFIDSHRSHLVLRVFSTKLEYQIDEILVPKKDSIEKFDIQHWL